MPKHSRVTDFKVGDQVVTTEAIKDVTWATPIPAGVQGTLTKLVRMQESLDGKSVFEVWSVALDTGVAADPGDPNSFRRFNLGVCHTQIQKTSFGFKN